MAFGNKSDPARNWLFHCVSPRRGTPAEQAIHAQLRLAHTLRNRIVELELSRRREARECSLRHSPDVEALAAECDRLTAEIDAATEDVRAAKVRTRTKTGDPVANQRLRELRAARREANAKRKDAVYAGYNAPLARIELDTIHADYRAKKEAARQEAVAAGLYWSTSLDVMARVKENGPPPTFKRWTGGGSIAIQLQRKGATGSEQEPVLDAEGKPKLRNGKPLLRAVASKPMGAAELFSGTNSQIRIRRLMLPDGSTHAKRVMIDWRVTSDEKGKPVWATIGPVVMHRPLPADATVKWVFLHRTMTGTQAKCSVRFVLTQPVWHPRKDQAKRGTVAVALGWRRIGNTLRVGHWYGDDGDHGDITISAERLSKFKHGDTLRAIRRLQFNEMRDRLAKWLEENAAIVPDVFASRVRPKRRDGDEREASTMPLHTLIASWKSENRLAALVSWWRENRFAGDEAIYTTMEGERIEVGTRPNGKPKYRYTGGRKQDKHLYDWWMSESEKCRRWRKWYYREIGLMLSKRYATIATAEIDWHRIAKTRNIEDNEAEVNKTNRGIAAVATLRDCLTNYAAKSVQPDAAGIATTCSRCGGDVEQPGAGRWIVCECCGGDRVDRAENAAKVLLGRVLRGTGEAEAARVPDGVDTMADATSDA